MRHEFRFDGAVLAGGASRRMGTDKALVEFGGEPLWRRQSETLRAAGASRVWVVRNPLQPPLPAASAVIHDRWANAGPIAGLEAALRTSTATHVAVLAVDLPRIDATWFEWLRSFCAPDVGALAEIDGGHFEPLAAIFPVCVHALVTERIAGGDCSLQALARRLIAHGHLRTVAPPPEWLNRLLNCNDPATLEAATSVQI